MPFVNPNYPLSELTRDVIARFYRTYDADLIVERTLIVEVKTGPLLDPGAIPQLLNYLNVTGLPLGLVLFFGPKPKVRRVIRDSTRQYPIMSR